jgi:hypothetical protein
MDDQTVIRRLEARRGELEEELAEITILLTAMNKPKRPGRSPEEMAQMRAKKAGAET